MQKFGKCVVNTNITMLALVILVLSENVGSLTVNVTRLEKNDKFSNPNRTAVSNCIAGGQSFYVDSCRSFRSIDTKGICSDSKSCCHWCQCKDDHPVYMFHLGRCINLQGLIADIFGQGSSGCGARLEVKASGNDDDDDDDDDDDESRHGKDVCKASPWLPPLINFQTKSDIKIKFCQPTSKDTESCDVEAARYVGGGQWTNFTDFQRRFWTTKNKKDIYLQWNKSAVTNLTGNLVVINVKCKQKCKGGQRKDFTSCFMFKTAGSFTATKKSAITTSAIKPSTTKPPSTKIVTTRNTTTKSTTETATSKETLPPTTKAEVTTGKGQVTEPAIQIQSTKKHGTGTTLISQTELSTKSSETPPTSSSDINTIPKETPNVISMTTAERSSPGKDKITDKSHDVNNSRRRTVMIVSVVSSLVVVAAMLFITAWLWRKRQRTKKHSRSDHQSTNQFHKPEDQVHDVDTQENAYQLLVYDGKSKEQAEREQPTYEGLVKGSTATDWGGGEIYTNPTMYQQLDKTNITDENDYLAAYHPLMTQLPSKSEQVPEYDQGYLVLVGEYGKKEETADQEDPYYYKVENSIPQ